MKKLLMTLVACATALLASAAITTSEGFEGTGLGGFSGTGGEQVAYDSAPSLANYPFASAGSKYCDIDADGTDTLSSPVASGATYFDMYIQFPANASEPDPELDSDAKLAVYVNASSNLVVLAGDGNGATVTNETGTTIAPGAWKRLTIAKVTGGYQVYVDGTAVSENAFTAINDGNPSTVAFTGCGKLDNFVARTTDPFYTGNYAASVGTGTDNEKYATYSAALADVLSSGATQAITIAGETPKTVDGTAANPYEITNLADLKALQSAVAAGKGADKCYVQKADIALTEAWPGIGVQNAKDLVSYKVSEIGQTEADRRDALFESASFKGTFDGQNHTISEFQIIGKGSNAEGLDYAGFFNCANGATIKNLKIQYKNGLFAADTTSATKESGATFVGVAKNSTLQNLTSLQKDASTGVSCSKGFGGIVGYLMGTTVDSCTNNLNMTSLANNKCGGIAMICQQANCSISNCVNNGTMTTGSSNGEFGGILGYTDAITIYNCQNTAACKMFYHHGGTVTLEGENKGNATVASYTGAATPGLNFATVDGDVATFVADNALVAGETYKVMSAGATATYAFAAAGEISFDTSLATPTYAITVANPNMFDVTSATEEDVTTYTAAGGTAVASLTKDEETTEYNTIAKALDAAENGDTVYLEADTNEDVSLPTGVSLALNEHNYSGTISAAAGNGYEIVNADGTYAVVNNTAETWIGTAGDNNWGTASNWSNGRVPTEYTDVTIPSADVPEGGWLIYIGGNSSAKSIAVLGDTTLQRDATISDNGCIVVQESVTTGETPATLTLNSSFVFAGANEVSISCPIVCANGNATKTSGFTSNSTGTFNISGAISGTGTLEFRKAVTLSQDLTVASDGLSVRFEAQPTFTNDSALKGDGTAAWTVEPGTAVQEMLQDSENWTGVCELVNVSKNSLRFQYYGNLESTVRLNGVTGYMAFPGNSNPQNDATVKVLDIAAGGLTLGDAFHSKTVVFDAKKITGSGPIKVGTKSSTSAAATVTKYVFTGDMSEFTGALNFGDLSSYRPEIVIATSSSNLPTPSDYGQIIVAEGATAYVNNTWTAPGGFVVAGKVVMGASGSIAGVNGVAGDGTITYSALPNTSAFSAPAFRETEFGSGIGTIPVWSGSVVLPATTISQKTGVPLIGLSSSNGTIVVKGITRSSEAISIHLNAGTKTIKGTVQLDGDLYITDGNSNATYTWNEISGTGNLFVTAAGGSAKGITHAITKLTGYTGEITAENSVSLTIGTVAVPEFTLGQKMVDLAANCNLVTSPGAINVEVDGMGSDLNGHHLFKAADGDLYVIAAQVTVDETTTCFATLEEAAEFALANDAQIAKVDPATPTQLPGWSYEQGVFTKLDVAQVGETTYKTLDLAIANAGTDDILLINDCAETVTLGKGQTIKPGIYSFSGVLKGEGTIYYAAKPNTVPKFEDWTGTFVADWSGGHSTSFPANDYGIEGSVVEVRKLGGGYVPRPGNENVDRVVLPAVSIPEGCCMKLANGYANTKTVFTKVTGAGAMTNNSYTVEIATLENFTGTISSDKGTKIGNVVTSTAAEPGDCLVKGGIFTDVASITVNGSVPAYALEYKADAEQPGIYYHVAATLNNGESIINHGTVVGALSAAYINLPRSFGWIVTVLDTEWEDTGAYDEYFTWNSESRTYTVKTYPVRIATKYYPTLEAAVAEAKDGDNIVLVDNITLDARVEPNLGAGTALTIDLGGYTITREGTSGNGSVFDVKSGNVVITNGVIDCTQDDTAIVADGVYAITARSGANVTLGGLTVTVDSQAGACAYPFAGATLAITSGTYRNNTAEPYQYKTGWTGMAVNQANVEQQLITISGGSFYQVNPAEGDDSGKVTSFLAANCESTYDSATGFWTVAEIQEVPVTPGAQTEPVETQAEAEAAAAKVVPSVPAAVAEALSDDQETAYKALFEPKVVPVTVGETTKYAVEVALKDTVVTEIQTAVDAEAEDLAKAAVKAAADAVAGGEAAVTTTPGLYYVVEAGSELNGIEPASCTLATSTTTKLNIPNKGTKGFYKISVSVTPVVVQE